MLRSMTENLAVKPTSPSENLFERYQTSKGVYDEFRAENEEPRPHWGRFTESLKRLGRHELASRWENGRRILREHGVTYNIYGDPQGMDRPWGLDLVPLLMAPEDWKRVEAGLAQRVQLLNLVLGDIYGGGQRLLRDGFIPPELVYSNPGFLRPCRGIRASHDVYLHLLACDLARNARGQWWVLSDRTQAPSGAGYALENRSVLSRILPEEISQENVHRLAGFFRAQRDMLFELAPEGRENPAVVLLTPGPHNETYFEHAYLARHLGFPLVEGADLTVRDRRVFLKTLDGLQAVDVILRRVDDSYCDPLELRSNSFLGVPGLVEATRAGNVTLANTLGTGLMESPVFLAFLPGLAKHLLGEELILPSVATWWCGQSRELRYVLEHLDELIIKPAFGHGSGHTRVSERLTSEERILLIEAIRSRPREFVAQERVVLSRAPVWSEGHFESRAVLLRAYVANGGERQAVLPGGLTRVSRSAEDPIVSMQSGSGSKDTWVIDQDTDLKPEFMSASVEPRSIDGRLSGVPSRAADNLYWLGRYTERLEQTLRILRCFMGRLSDEISARGSPEFLALIDLTAGMGLVPSSMRDQFDRTELHQLVLNRVYKPEMPGSVRELLGRIRFIASTVRDRFSGDTWRILGRLELDSRSRPGRLPLANALTVIQNLILDLAAFNGMEMENMTRGHGWRFLDVGRRVERGQSIVQLVRVAVGLRGVGVSALEPVLEIADSLMTYRRRYFAEPRLPGILELLLCDKSNPRGLAFQVDSLEEHVAALPGAPDGGSSDGSVSHWHFERLRHWIQEIDRLRLAPVGDGIDSERLIGHLDSCAVELAAISDTLTGRFFSHTVPRMS